MYLDKCPNCKIPFLMEENGKFHSELEEKSIVNNYRSLVLELLQENQKLQGELSDKKRDQNSMEIDICANKSINSRLESIENSSENSSFYRIPKNLEEDGEIEQTNQENGYKADGNLFYDISKYTC